MFEVIVLTHEKTVFEGKTESLKLPGSLGYFEVLKDHASLISSLIPGKMTIQQPDGTKAVYAISGGIVEVNEDKVIVLGDAIEKDSEIDLPKAEEALYRAEKRLEEFSDVVDQHRANQAYLRAKNRVQIAKEHR